MKIDTKIDTIKEAKRLIRIVIGFTILIIGLALLVLPGPGILFIILSLTILATEFIWAKRLLNKVKEESKQVYKKIKKGAKKL